MQLSRQRIVARRDTKTIKLHTLGDIHLGAAACDIEHFRRTVRAIADDPDAYWLGMGDMGDCIAPSDPRFSYAGNDWKHLGYLNGRPNPDNFAFEQYELVKRELAPIASKCIGIHEGNHEASFRKYYFVDIGRMLAKEFDVPYLEYTALTRLDIEIPQGPRGHHRVWTTTIFSEHGASGGGTQGNAVNAILRRGNEFEAQVFLKGHVHIKGQARKSTLAWGGKQYRKQDRVFVLTGTYLKGYVVNELTYGERQAYAPNEIGGMVVLFDIKGERIHAVDAEAVGLVAA